MISGENRLIPPWLDGISISVNGRFAIAIGMLGLFWRAVCLSGSARGWSDDSASHGDTRPRLLFACQDRQWCVFQYYYFIGRIGMDF